MDVTLLHGYSAGQLKGVNFDAIAKAYPQESTSTSVSEIRFDGVEHRIETPKLQDTLAVEKLKTVYQEVNPYGHLGEELRLASAKLSRHEDLHNETVSIVSPYQFREEGVMPIAIVGMSCRFPGGASDVEKFWGLVAEGRSAWSRIPENRFNVDAFYHSDGSRTNTVSSRALVSPL